MKAPIYIIGTERSGSNLLRLILNAHPAIHVPHPPHIMNYFAGIERCYGALDVFDNRLLLARDISRFVDHHIYPWDFKLDPQQLAERARPADLFGVFGAVYEAALQASGKQRWGCKSTFMVHHIGRAVRRDPKARFVWLVRDPRDVAVSAKRSVFSHFHPYNTATLWLDEQNAARTWGNQLGADTVHRLRYEDLLAAPEDRLRDVFAFLDEPWDPGVLRFFETPEAKRSAALSESWQNTARPIQQDNHDKWRTELLRGQLLAVEAVAGSMMEALGYQPSIPARERRAFAPKKLRIATAEAAYRARVELRSLRADRNHWRRWDRDLMARRIARRRCG